MAASSHCRFRERAGARARDGFDRAIVCRWSDGDGKEALVGAAYPRRPVQTRDTVVVCNEMIHDARIVPMDGRPQLPPRIRPLLGDSRGRWDGDTLVIDTTNFSDRTSFRGSDENLHLIERFTRTAAGTLPPLAFGDLPIEAEPLDLCQHGIFWRGHGKAGSIGGLIERLRPWPVQPPADRMAGPSRRRHRF